MMLPETELSGNPTLQTESQSSNLESKISDLHTMGEINYNSVIEEQIANIPQTNIGELSRQIQNKLDELRKQQYNGDTSSLPKFFTPERRDLDSSIEGDAQSENDCKGEQSEDTGASKNITPEDNKKPEASENELEDTSEIQEKEPATLENNENDALDTSEATSEAETPEKKGGSYGDVFKEGEGDQYEVHHMPADSASNLERNDGPAIKMEKEDHRQTASCGSSAEAREYREKQKELIKNGKFREALQMDIDDIHEKFGDKYDDAIAEMMEYVDQLEQEGKI